MFQHHILKTLLIGLVMLLFACKKEDQNFQYEKLNEITIKTDTLNFSVTQLDTLKIIPTITESLPDGTQMDYEWKIYAQTGTNASAIVLSNDKLLNAEITLSPDNYFLQFKVTNKSNNVSKYAIYNVSVNGAFYEGWLVSNNHGGNAHLSFLREDDVILHSAAAAVNNKIYPGNALSAYSATGFNMAVVMFFTDQGVYRLNANDFVQNASTIGVFTGGMQFSGSPVYGLNKFESDQYIVNNGGLYAGLGAAFYPGEVLQPFSDRFPGDYSLFPTVIASSQGGTYFYDNKYKRFLDVSYTGRTLNVSSGSAAAAFDLSNVGMTMVACDLGVQSYSDDEYFFVMQGTSSRYLLSLKGTIPGMNQQILNSPEIASAVHFATSSVVKQMYYATDSKIYLYDMLANSSRVVYTFPTGSKISSLKMLRSTSKRIVAAVNTSAGGSVYYFDLDNTGDLIGNTYSNKFDGFGQISGLSYRNPS